MEDREMPRKCKCGEGKFTQIMMAIVLHVTSTSGLRKFQADGFLFDGVYTHMKNVKYYARYISHVCHRMR